MYIITGPGPITGPLSESMSFEDARYYAAWLTRIRGERYRAVYEHTAF